MVGWCQPADEDATVEPGVGQSPAVDQYIQAPTRDPVFILDPLWDDLNSP